MIGLIHNLNLQFKTFTKKQYKDCKLTKVVTMTDIFSDRYGLILGKECFNFELKLS